MSMAWELEKVVGSGICGVNASCFCCQAKGSYGHGRLGNDSETVFIEGNKETNYLAGKFDGQDVADREVEEKIVKTPEHNTTTEENLMACIEKKMRQEFEKRGASHPKITQQFVDLAESPVRLSDEKVGEDVVIEEKPRMVMDEQVKVREEGGL
ncbi:hypothetical protein SUGI_0495470 [Cryptomeria japonica]|nr:hypothetical protein SUGI_0495470 [Cryptomeria japonica]